MNFHYFSYISITTISNHIIYADFRSATFWLLFCKFPNWEILIQTMHSHHQKFLKNFSDIHWSQTRKNHLIWPSPCWDMVQMMFVLHNLIHIKTAVSSQPQQLWTWFLCKFILNNCINDFCILSFFGNFPCTAT